MHESKQMKKQTQLAGLWPEILNNESLSESSVASVANLKKQSQLFRDAFCVMRDAERKNAKQSQSTGRNPVVPSPFGFAQGKLRRGI